LITKKYVADANLKCEFNYKKSGREEYFQNGCGFYHMLVQSLAKPFNSTILFLPEELSRGSQLFVNGIGRHIRGFVFIGTVGWNVAGEPHAPDKVISYRYTRMKYSSIFYCTQNAQREAFTILFWTYPIDLWSWMFLGIAAIALTIMLRGDWLPIFAILMRQSCSMLNRHKVLILFIFSSIIFTYGYEGIVSSLLTVPPPYKTFKNMTELFAAGYKLLFPSTLLKAVSTDTNDTQKHERLNISNKDMDNMQSFSVPDSYINFIQLFAACNVTIVTDSSVLFTNKISLMEILPTGAMCHGIAAPEFVIRWVYTFMGEDHLVLNAMTRNLHESGILSLYLDYETYTVSYPDKRKIEMSENWKATSVVAFQMLDWKMFSIFTVWCVCLAISLSIFIIEKVFEYIVRKVCRGFILKILYTALHVVRYSLSVKELFKAALQAEVQC